MTERFTKLGLFERGLIVPAECIQVEGREQLFFVSSKCQAIVTAYPEDVSILRKEVYRTYGYQNNTVLAGELRDFINKETQL